MTAKFYSSRSIVGFSVPSITAKEIADYCGTNAFELEQLSQTEWILKRGTQTPFAHFRPNGKNGDKWVRFDRQFAPWGNNYDPHVPKIAKWHRIDSSQRIRIIVTNEDAPRMRGRRSARLLPVAGVSDFGADFARLKARAVQEAIKFEIQGGELVAIQSKIFR